MQIRGRVLQASCQPVDDAELVPETRIRKRWRGNVNSQFMNMQPFTRLVATDARVQSTHMLKSVHARVAIHPA